MFAEKLAIYAILVLVPLIPAVVLFGTLRKTRKRPDADAKISGTVAGIPMELSGSIAGYFAVAAFFAYIVGPHLYPQSARIVHVRGSMKFAPGATPSAADIKAEMHPPDLDVRDGHSFDWPVTIVEGAPAVIVLQPAGYEGQTLYLSGDVPFGAPNYKHHPDKDGNIVFEEPIVFQKEPASAVETGKLTSSGG
jgi:hypothetical protein